MIPLLVSAIATTLIASSPPRWCQPAFAVDRGQETVAPSLAGLPGLFQVPEAVSDLDKSTLLSFNDVHIRGIPGSSPQQRNAFIGFGFLPRLSLAARASYTLYGLHTLRDISASGQVLVAREGAWTPSLAVGAQDFGGRAAVSYFVTRYATASKTLFDVVRLTVGVGKHGTYSLSGPFGGVQVAPCNWLSAIGENDGRHTAYGLRLTPTAVVGPDHRVTPTFDVLWRQGQGSVLGVGLRLTPGVAHPSHPRPSATDSTHVFESVPSDAPEPTALRDALVRYGFENVRVSRAGDSVAVSYENRVFNREEWDALGIVFAEAARHANGATTMRATILRVGLPMMEVTSDIDAFRAFVGGTTSADAFARQLVVRYPAASVQAGQPSNPSRFHLDLTATPRFEPLLFSEISDAESRTSVLPQAILQLGAGLSLTARHAYVVGKTARFPVQISNPNADQLLMHAARVGLPFGLSVPGLVSQVTVGRFAYDEVGGSLESDILLGGHFSVGGIVAALGAKPGEVDRSMGVGSVRYRYAPLDLEATVTAGRYVRGDVGGTFDVGRRFGLMEVGFFAQATDFAKMAGARVAIPLMFARDLKPAPVRVRMPGYYDYSLRTQVLARNNVRTDVAVPLQTGMDLERVFRDRDRLNSVGLGLDIDALRAAALEWGRP